MKYPSDSMYRGKEIFTREQLTFFAETVLTSALDMLDGYLPHNMSWVEYQKASEDFARKMPDGYRKGIIEQAGMTLAILYAQLTGDNASVYDALILAADFDTAVNHCFERAWADHGEAVRKEIEKSGGSFRVSEVIPNYPDTRYHAEAFASTIINWFWR
jgi:hypothetical protein